MSDYTGIGGPGDFFAIFAVFDLSGDSVDAIEAGGLAFLQGLGTGLVTTIRGRRHCDIGVQCSQRPDLFSRAIPVAPGR